MIARLRGALAELDGVRAVVDCGGVGYDVTVTGTTALALPSPGADVVLLIRTQFNPQDGSITLYGFGNERERDLFDALLTVKNVGPSLAVLILSAAAPATIARMIAESDLAGLTTIKKVGKKMAERLIVELRERCESLLLAWGGEEPIARPARPARAPVLDEVTSALVNLGWRPAEVDKAVAQLTIAEHASVEDLVREALRAMQR